MSLTSSNQQTFVKAPRSPGFWLTLLIVAGMSTPASSADRRWSLPDWMIEMGSDSKNELEAAQSWLEYFKQKQSQPGNVDTDQINKMVERLQEFVGDAPPPDRPPRLPSAERLPGTADMGAPKAPRGNQTVPNRTVDLGTKGPTGSGTKATEAVAREVTEEVTEGALKQTARGAGRVVGKILPLVDLAIWAVDAYDGTTSFLAAQEAFANEQAAEEAHEQLVTKELLELHRAFNKDPEKFNKAYTLEEMENLVRINLDQGHEPFAGLENEAPPAEPAVEPPAAEPPAVAVQPPALPAAPPTPPTEALSEDEETIRRFLELMARVEQKPEPVPVVVGTEVEPPVVAEPVIVEPPVVVTEPTQPVEPLVTTTGITDDLDFLVPPSGPQNANRLDVLQSFLNQMEHRSHAGHSSGSSSGSSAAQSLAGSAAGAAVLQRLQSDPALRQRLLDAARSSAGTAGRTNPNPVLGNALRNGAANAGQAGTAPQLGDRLRAAAANAGQTGTAPRLGDRLGAAAANGGAGAGNGAGIGNGAAAQAFKNRMQQNQTAPTAPRPAVGNNGTTLRDRIQNANPPAQNGMRPAAGGLRGRLGNRR